MDRFCTLVQKQLFFTLSDQPWHCWHNQGISWWTLFGKFPQERLDWISKAHGSSFCPKLFFYKKGAQADEKKHMSANLGQIAVDTSQRWVKKQRRLLGFRGQQQLCLFLTVLVCCKMRPQREKNKEKAKDLLRTLEETKKCWNNGWLSMRKRPLKLICTWCDECALGGQNALPWQEIHVSQVSFSLQRYQKEHLAQTLLICWETFCSRVSCF